MQGLVYVLSGRTCKLGFRSRDEAVTRDRSLGLVGSLRLDRRWVLFIIILPFLGMFAYLIARGGGMQQRSTEQTAEIQKQQDAYIKSVAGQGGGGSAPDQIASAKQLLDNGIITQAEFGQMRAKALS